MATAHASVADITPWELGQPREQLHQPSWVEKMSFSAALSCGRHYFSPHKMAAKNHRLSWISRTYTAVGKSLCVTECAKYTTEVPTEQIARPVQEHTIVSQLSIGDWHWHRAKHDVLWNFFFKKRPKVEKYETTNIRKKKEEKKRISRRLQQCYACYVLCMYVCGIQIIFYKTCLSIYLNNNNSCLQWSFSSADSSPQLWSRNS